MASEHDNDGDPRYTAVYRGVVADNADPLKIGRCRVRVPGLIEPASAWAHPFTVGGGSAGRGFFFAPEVGSEVAVFFHQGDVDHPHFICGVWNAPGGASTVNARVAAKTPGEAVKVKVIETERWLMVLDDSADTPGFVISDKQSGGLDGIEFDGVLRTMTIKATSRLVIQSVGQIDISGLAVTINGRPVLPSSEPI